MVQNSCPICRSQPLVSATLLRMGDKGWLSHGCLERVWKTEWIIKFEMESRIKKGKTISTD